jgi:hypothetical protein
MRDYVSYHHEGRIHDSLEKDTPDKRAIERKPAATANVTSLPRLVACTLGDHPKPAIEDHFKTGQR